MSVLKFEDLKNKTVKELLQVLAEVKKEMFNLRFQKTSGAAVSPSRVRSLRKTVARIKTIFNEKK